ncbi:HEAT repeat domain-containing protein [Paludisphaera soli]|uniref:HEAT repeat domain-containing protein n=1 Tax=Paludisphaera soli TaxID=2712865 RepID=UPI0013EAB329|nr:HEAT repeat domain-containing protein [Paludisphaera soli]
MRFPRVRFTRRLRPPPAEDAGGARKPGFSVLVLMGVVATCGLTFWAVRVVRDSLAPVHGWSRMLRDGDVDQRLEAVAGLATIDGPHVPTALPALSAAVRDGNDRVAAMASQALTQASLAALRSGDPASSRRAVEALAVALGDPRPEIRTWAALGIAGSGAGQLGAEGASAWTDPLIAALGDPDETVRLSAAKALGQVQCGGIGLAALEATLGSDASERVRVESARALGSCRTDFDRVTLVLIRALRTNHGEVRDACAGSLSLILEDPSRRRSEAIVPQLVEALSDAEPEVRCQAAAVLGEIGAAAEPGLPALVAMLNEPEPERGTMSYGPGGWIRWEPVSNAARALGRIAPGTSSEEEAAAALLAALREEKSDLRRAAFAQGLAEFGPELGGPAVPILLEILREAAGRAKSGPPAPAVCLALGRLAPRSPLADDVLAALTSSLDSKDDDTRLAAAEALGAFGPRAKSALPRLRDLAGPAEQGRWERPTVLTAIHRIEGEPASDGSAAGPSE